MAVFTIKECPWTITGESACGENFENAPATAKLGEFCDYKSCIEGVCIRPNEKSPNVCTMILSKDAKGCSKDNYDCDKNLRCNNDVCESIVTTTPTTPTTPTTTTESSQTSVPTKPVEIVKSQTNTTTTNYDKLALYIFMGVISVLLLIMLILLAVRR